MEDCGPKVRGLTVKENKTISTDSDLNERIDVVTGAAQGLGLAIARRLAERGVNVVMADIQVEKVQQSAAALEERRFASAAPNFGHRQQ